MLPELLAETWALIWLLSVIPVLIWTFPPWTAPDEVYRCITTAVPDPSTFGEY